MKCDQSCFIIRCLKKTRVGTAISSVNLSNLTAYIVKYLFPAVGHLETCLLCFNWQLVVRTWKCFSLRAGCLLNNILIVNSTQLHTKKDTFSHFLQCFENSGWMSQANMILCQIQCPLNSLFPTQ